MTKSTSTLQKFFIIILISTYTLCHNNPTKNASMEIESSEDDSDVYYIRPIYTEFQEARQSIKNISAIPDNDQAIDNSKVRNKKIKKRKNSALNAAIQLAAEQGLNATIDLFERMEPEILQKGEILEIDHPASKLSLFSAPMNNESNIDEAKVAYASLYVAKKLQESINLDFTGLGRHTGQKKKISLRQTALESLCPPRDPPQCVPATKRYRTHDGTCNNFRKPRWGSSHLPFHRFLHPEYADGLEAIRNSIDGGPLPSARFVSLVVHGFKNDESQVTMMLLQWGQLIDHDLTATLQPRSINGSIPRCCESETVHPSCLPMKVPRDDPFLAPLGVRCLEFLRSAPAQRRDCFLSWREQTNQVTSYIDASPVYSSNPRTADAARILRDGLLLFGRGSPREDICLHGGFGHQCIRAGDTRAGEQPGLLALHTIFVAEHNRIALELSDLNPHWSDEKLYQETRRIIGAMFQHITYREFLPLVLGREVCRLFDLELRTSGYYDGYDPKVNPTVANAFSAAAFRFGHAMVQGTILRSDTNYRFIDNNVTLHDENSHGDIGNSGSLHRIIRGLTTQRTLKRDEFMSPELTNHLFQSGPFPFGMDLAAINIQRGRDHGIPPYVDWREPCGLSQIKSWDDMEVVVGPNSANRLRRAYTNIDDIDLFVGGISERPVRGGLVGPTFACIIAQQFSNLRKGDRFWYENSGFESSFTLAQLNALRHVSLSQILCRSLGSSNVMQPHSFLPHEFPGNERIRCGVGILAPMNLSPWIERDPFNKEADFDTTNLIEPQINIFLTDHNIPVIHSTTTLSPLLNFEQINDVTFTKGKPHSTSRPNIAHVSNNVDFSEAVLTSKKPTTTKRPPMTISNKVDFSTMTSTTKRKKKTTVATKRPNTAIIDNKIDFSTTFRPSNNPFSKKSNLTVSTIVRRSTDKNKNRLDDKLQHRSDATDLTDDTLKVNTSLTKITPKTFRNEDNATKYLDNKAITSTTLHSDSNKDATDSNEQIESRINHKFYSNTGSIKQYENYYNHENDNYRPNFDMYSIQQRPNNNFYPLYPPLTQPSQMTSKRPLSYQNNKPNYDSQYTRPKPLDEKPIVSPISNKLSTPFSYDTNYFGSTYSSMTPNGNYDNMAVPLNVSPNRYGNKRPTAQYYNNRQTYATTKRSDFSTFLIVETTRRTSPSPQHYFIHVDRTTRRPYKDFSIASSHLLQSLFPTSPIGNFYSSSNHEAIDYSNPTYLISSVNANKKYTNKPTHVKVSSSSFSSGYKKPTFNSETYDHDEDFDGYLRPENNFYAPLTNNYKFSSYNDYYTKYNDKPESSTSHSVKYYFKQNILHKYHTIKTGEPKEGLYDKDNKDDDSTKRYAELYDEPLKINNDNNTEIDDLAETKLTKTNIDDIDIGDEGRLGRVDKRKQNFGSSLFVPFKVLTRIERPDNWVNVDVDDNNGTLPDIPTINQDENIARELPKPFKQKLLFGGSE